MGITGLYDVICESAKPFPNKNFAGKRVGVDVSYDIHRASRGMEMVKSLTDATGTKTLFLNTILCNIVGYKKIGVTGLIYVFDSPRPNAIKAAECERRRAVRHCAEKKLVEDAGLNGDRTDMLEKTAFTITGSIIEDVKKLLGLLGVAWIVAPDNFEAEHLGAELTRDGVIDIFVTSDSDAIVFGARTIVRRVKHKGAKKSSLEEYTLDTILEHNKLTREGLAHIAVVLGCDFASKTKGIAAKTVLSRGPTATLTEEQLRAKNYFLSTCPYTMDMIVKSAANITNLVEWLVHDKKFNETRITKMLEVFPRV